MLLYPPMKMGMLMSNSYTCCEMKQNHMHKTHEHSKYWELILLFTWFTSLSFSTVYAVSLGSETIQGFLLQCCRFRAHAYLWPDFPSCLSEILRWCVCFSSRYSFNSPTKTFWFVLIRFEEYIFLLFLLLAQSWNCHQGKSRTCLVICF